MLLTIAVAAATALLPVILVDNGSKRPSSTLALRHSASKLSRKLGGREVLPASLAYSDTIAIDKLDGVPATTLSSSLSALLARGENGAVVCPLFLGPSGGFSRALATCQEEVASSTFELHTAACLVDDTTDAHAADTRIAQALAEEVLAVASASGENGDATAPPLPSPLNVVLVDHGTPSKKVNAVRERLARQLGSVLGEKAATVQAASMERREGAEYDFNEPLLERALAAPPFNAGDVVLAMAFLLPGRHAGEGGDVMQIVDDAIAGAATGQEGAALRVRATPPLASHPKVIEVLADRVLGVDAAIAREAGEDEAAGGVAPLARFRTLMGALYGVAGLAHAADLLLGSSQLFAAAGAPPFAMLPPPAQALALVWCAAGPLAFVTSRQGGRLADAGLVAYGLVEVIGAALVAASVDASALPPGAIAALPNALAVQGVVAASWVYSATRRAQ